MASDRLRALAIAAGVVFAVAAVVFLFVPFDGPVGEVVCGLVSAASFSVGFGTSGKRKR